MEKPNRMAFPGSERKRTEKTFTVCSLVFSMFPWKTQAVESSTSGRKQAKKQIGGDGMCDALPYRNRKLGQRKGSHLNTLPLYSGHSLNDPS